MNRRIFVCGSTESGRTGISISERNKQEKLSSPTELKSIPLGPYEYIKSVCASFKSTYFITSEGRVFVTGKGSDYLGLGNTNDVSTPTLMNFGNYKIEEISSILSHSIARTKCGNVFTWGCGDKFQLGHGDCKNRLTPTLVKFFENKRAKIVAAGAKISLVHTSDLKLYGMGPRWLLESTFGYMIEPEELTTFSNVDIRQIEATDHITIITNDGRVYTFGFNGHGECGLNRMENWITQPCLINIPERVIQIANGYNHTLCLSESGIVYAFGFNNYYQMGIEMNKNMYRMPKRIHSLKNRVIAIYARGFHSFFIMEDYTILGCGGNKKGQVGIGTLSHVVKKPKKVINLEGIQIEYISCGFSHSVFLEKKKERPFIQKFYSIFKSHDVLFKF